MAGNLFWFNDDQWAKIEPHLPRNQRGPTRKDDRRVLSGIMHVLKIGCRWQDAPKNTVKPLWRFSLHHIDLMAEYQVLRFELGSRPQEPRDRPPDQFEQIPHDAEHRPINGLTPGE